MARKLTAKQEKFAQLYIELGNATAAYKGAYSTARMKPATVNNNAYALLQNSEITARIDALQSQAAEKAVLTKAWILERLMRNARICLGEETIKLAIRPRDAESTIELDISDREGSAANRALELLGKEMGMFVERTENLNTRYVVGIDRLPTDAEFEAEYLGGQHVH